MSRIDDWQTQLLEGKPLQGKTEHHKLCNDLMEEYRKTLESGDSMSFKKAYKLRDQIRTAVIQLNYRPTDRGMNPKEVPVEHLKWCVMHPILLTFTSKDARERVDSPIKGIRAFCMECQGSDSSGVRECASVNCAFWPFRMGTNVFSGKLAASEQGMTDAEVELEEEELDGDQTSV